MVSVKRLAPNIVEGILKKVDPKRQFSATQVSNVTSTLNDILSRYALSEKERDTEPTAKKLNKQIDALHNALKRLKLALPKPAQRSLYNYLVHAGEAADGTGHAD
jgi:seryl-tRNA(Sec) selenium transferase